MEEASSRRAQTEDTKFLGDLIIASTHLIVEEWKANPHQVL